MDPIEHKYLPPSQALLEVVGASGLWSSSLAVCQALLPLRCPHLQPAQQSVVLAVHVVSLIKLELSCCLWAQSHT